MKGPRELKRYIALYRKQLKRHHFDDLLIFRLQDNCKKWYDRRKFKSFKIEED